MTTRGSQTITWDVENRPVAITGGTSFVYDGDGNRVKKTENSQMILYVNQYYEKNLSTGDVTTYYYLGGKLIAKRSGTTLNYIHQDSLNSTSVVSDSNGSSTGTIKFYPFGSTLTSSGTLPAQKFTGQRLDDTGLYYYNARYYDASIGRFISPDTVVQSFSNPQTLNRYSYCVNNPLKYTDPSGNYVYASGPNRQTLWNAWVNLWNKGGDKGRDMFIALTVSPVAIEITTQAADSSVVRGSAWTGKEVMYISESLIGGDINVLSTSIAHESWHAKEGHQSDSIQEEVQAYQLEYDIGNNLGLDMDHRFAGNFKDFDPKSKTDLQSAWGILTDPSKVSDSNTNTAYKACTLYPSVLWGGLDDLVMGARWASQQIGADAESTYAPYMNYNPWIYTWGY